MDVVEECRKIEVIVIIFLKIEKCYVRGFYVKWILYIFLGYLVYIFYIWSIVYEKRINRILVYYILGE